MRLPERGLPRAAVMARLKELHARDADWRGGRLFGYVYNAGDDAAALVEEVATLFAHSNGLSLSAFPSLRQIESELLQMTAALLNGPECVGALTSGGTESITMALLAAREWAKAERGISTPEVIAPISAHPAFEKAAHYLGLRLVRTPVGPDFRADLGAMREALNDRTALLVGSAPNFPQGVIDPIAAIAGLAQERGLLCHVDACMGGFMLPFLARLGEPIPAFDFGVPGVTSISADLHKYGYAAKGVSAVLYRERELRRRQFFVYTDWPGGVYASPTAQGAKSGAPMASAWAIIQHLGEAGFVDNARRALAATRKLRDGIRARPGLRVLGEPQMTLLSFTADDANIYALGEALAARHWHLDRQQLPPSLHMTVSPKHLETADTFLADLATAHGAVRGQPPPDSGMAAVYGMMSTIEDRQGLRDFVLGYLDGLE